VSKYRFNDDMQEISGFGGNYEACCRRMLAAALEWLDANPQADPQFSGYKNIYGVINEDNEDAKALSRAALDGAGEYGPSGAQHQAVITTALWIKANGWWPAYVKQMTHPEGQVGILKDKLARAKEDLEGARMRCEELMEENLKRGTIIAEKVLGWQRYKVENGMQMAYAPSKEALERIICGDSLFKLVDEAIQQLSPTREAA